MSSGRKQRWQAERRRERDAAAKTERAAAVAATDTQDTHRQLEAGTRPIEVDGRPEAPVNEGAKIEMTATELREALWAGYRRFALYLHRRGELASFQEDFRSGGSLEVEARQLMNAAIEFVTQRGRGRPSKWSPAPTDEQLEDLPAWITQRLADESTEREAAERRMRLEKRLARELGKGTAQTPIGNGSRTGPVYQQTSKHDLEELARRLEWTMALHQAERGTFQRTWLDARSPYYIPDRDGGIGTKGIIFMANAIVGRQERRDYEENWTIVMDWLRERQASQGKAKSQEP
jgi:hypothetical protein